MNHKTAIFAAGCFWGVEKNFTELNGVVSTRVGYTGGDTDNPTYDEVCAKNTGHAEAVEVTYDPQEISYQDLLKAFFAMHTPSGASERKSQYRSAIFYCDDEQKQAAEAYIQEAGGQSGKTEITAADTFWEAEPYHQKYYLKG